MHVALASCVELPESDHDEAPLLEALAAAGISAAAPAWDDPAVDWSTARLTVLRATWNYHLQPEAFASWLEATAAVTDLWNRLPAVRWNLHKSYLLDLQRHGVAVTPTELLPRGSNRTLAEVKAARGWRDLVVKPAVSASSYRTKRIRADSTAAGEADLRALTADGDTLVQSYLPSVEEYGERALVWVDGRLTHAVRKSPRFDDDQESTSAALPIAPAEAELAAAALARVVEVLGEPPMYARFDVAPGPGGDPLLMELELIEPSLYFQQSAEALDRMVTAIQRRLNTSAPTGPPDEGR